MGYGGTDAHTVLHTGAGAREGHREWELLSFHEEHFSFSCLPAGQVSMNQSHGDQIEPERWGPEC